MNIFGQMLSAFEVLGLVVVGILLIVILNDIRQRRRLD
jgi:hypothetical protein